MFQKKQFEPANTKISVAEFFLILLLAVVVIKTAWLSDDAFITFRTVSNFIHGYGLTWNAVERVQVFTHPLWMFLLSGFYLFTKELFFTSTFLQLALVVITSFLLCLKIARGRTAALISLALLILSKSFIDYSTSGLENSLSYLLLTLFFIFFVFPQKSDRRQLILVSAMSSLIILNRSDLLLLILPVLIFTIWQSKLTLKDKVVSLVLGFSPLLLWEVFSLLYFGYLVPNTAFAKLNTGIAKMPLILQGLRYFLSLLYQDPLSLIVIISAIFLPFVRRNKKMILLSSGLALYLIYILYIGGDFMAGRFFAVPFLLSVMIFSHTVQLEDLSSSLPVLGAIIFIAISSYNYSPLTSTSSFGQNIPDKDFYVAKGVGDERANYYPYTGLLRSSRLENTLMKHSWVQEGIVLKNSPEPRVEHRISIGMAGYYAGPGSYIIDSVALSDPLLSKLPVKGKKLGFIGHFVREIPCGYTDSVKANQNLICDPALKQYYDKIIIITREPVFSPVRIKTIILMNLGHYDCLLEEYLSRSQT